MAAPLLVAVAAEPASTQKTGGILKMYSPDSPASMSIHEEATFVAEGPMMGVFNNLDRVEAVLLHLLVEHDEIIGQSHSWPLRSERAFLVVRHPRRPLAGVSFLGAVG